MSDQPVPPASDPDRPLQPVVQSDPRPPSGRDAAVTAIICGILGPFAIIGLIFGIVAWRRELHPGRGESKKLAITGTIISACMLSTCSGMYACFVVDMQQAMKRSSQAWDMRRLHDVYDAMKAYALANHDELPPPGTDWKSLVAATNPHPGEYGGWGYPGHLDNMQYVPPQKPLSQIPKSAARVLLVQDPYPGAHRSWIAVLFADGHTGILESDDRAQLNGLILSDGSAYVVPGMKIPKSSN